MPNSMDYIFDKILYELNQYIETNTNKVTDREIIWFRIIKTLNQKA